MSSGVDSAPDEAGDALAQRFVKGFFGFFVLVATTLYTANLAAMLSDDAAYDLEIDSIAACEAARCSVCVHAQTWAYAAEVFAASPLRRVEGGWTAAANYARLTAGDCDAIMLSYSDYVTLDVNEAQNLGAYQFVGRPAFSYPEALAVAASLFLIVALSIVLGAALPIFLEKINAGASNAATTIQVVMDVSGVLITCAVCGYLLDGTSPLSVLLPGVGG